MQVLNTSQSGVIDLKTPYERAARMQSKTMTKAETNEAEAFEKLQKEKLKQVAETRPTINFFN